MVWLSDLGLTPGEAQGGWFYLEGVFVDEDVQPSLHLLGFTEENKLLKQEDVTLTFPPPCPDSELILADQLTLLLQVHLDRDSLVQLLSSDCFVRNPENQFTI